MYKYLIILFVIFLIIISLIMINYLLTNKNNYVYKFSSENYSNNYLENFTDKTNDKTNKIIEKKDYNNLIENGYFQHGKKSPNHNTHSGYNKIIIMKNPGKSPYVLEQKKSDNLTYCQFICKNVKNSKYQLYFWVSIIDNIEELNLDSLIYIKIQNEDFSNYIPRLNYNIIQKIIMDNDTEWYLLKYEFISGNNTTDKMEIYLNYSDNLKFNYYFTNISLYRVLVDAENFIFNDGLISYVDGYHYETNNTTWRDLSGMGNDLFFSTIPTANNSIGSLNITNCKITGFSSNILSNKEFSILICLNKNYENSASDEKMIDINSEDSENLEHYLISIPGNDRYSFEIKLKDKYLYLVNENKEYQSKNEIILYNKTLISILYNNNIIDIYYDGVNVISEKIKNIYFNTNNIIINKNKILNYNLYSILFYNKVLDNISLNEIRDYFIQNKNKDFTLPDINNYHMNNNSSYSLNNLDNYLFKAFNKKDSLNFIENNEFKKTFDNQTFKIKNDKNSCKNECTSLCYKFLNDNDLSKYNKCISNCKNVLTSCEKFCKDKKNDSSIYCNLNKNSKDDCPKVYKKNGNYNVYIAPNSYYDKLLNYNGDKSYGKNIEKARYTYNLNFPKCPIPDELLPLNKKNKKNNCPYIINESNPCFSSFCSNVNWNVDNYKDLNLNKNCKKNVSNYCQINYKIDDKCVCWNPEYKDDSKCIEFRRYFEDPNDYCLPSQFKIEEHPDFHKYIKKDNIPCWGCNINN